MDNFILFIAPAILAIWLMSPFCWKKTKFTARRSPVFAWVPTQSKLGNDPLSQRVHELGGLRYSGLITAIMMALAGALAGDPLSAVLIQLAIFGISSRLLVGPIDITEHYAECLFADDQKRKGKLHPEALAWMALNGHSTYLEAEADRMTRSGEEYDHLTADRFRRLMEGRGFRARLIVLLARLP